MLAALMANGFDSFENSYCPKIVLYLLPLYWFTKTAVTIAPTVYPIASNAVQNKLQSFTTYTPLNMLSIKNLFLMQISLFIFHNKLLSDELHRGSFLLLAANLLKLHVPKTEFFQKHYCYL